MKLFEELKWRGLIKDITSPELEEKLNNENAMLQTKISSLEEKLKELIWQEVKKVNKTMPAYKYIREITLTDKELIKTTTQKIKRFEEMKNVI